jgi:uncharacterized LabA/DUF88 family protein
MRTIVYVDGFNLYHRALQRRPEFRWLNLKTLADTVLSEANTVTAVRFYTAHVSAKIDPDAPRKQQIYLDALATVPEISVHFGNFLVTEKYARLPVPKPGKTTFKPWPDVVLVQKIEEKGSDVNLAAHLLRDAYTDQFDVAAVITNDTDLVEPIRIVVQDLKRPVGILTPVPKPAGSLAAVASFVRHIRDDHLARSQFPEEIITTAGKTVIKPADWVARDSAG